MKKGADYEEFLCLMLECYETFKEVMKKGNPVEKAFAMKGFYTLQQMIKERLGQVSEEKETDIKSMEEVLCRSNVKFSEVCGETKERLLELRKEIEPLLEKSRNEGGKTLHKKKRKRAMEKRLKVKG